VPPLEKNETQTNLKTLKIRPVELPVRGVCEFLKFNFFTDHEVSLPPKVLTPFNLPKKIEVQLYRLQQKQSWLSNSDIAHGLNLPKHKQILCAPLNFKYVYDYVAIHKTNSYFTENCISDEVLSTPANSIKFKKFYDYLV
jgi:hypothetical protein